MENNQDSLINSDLIKSSGRYLKWIGYLIFMYFLISVLINLSISDVQSIKKMENLIQIWKIISFIFLVLVGSFFIQSGKELIRSLDNSIINYRELLNGETIKILSKNKKIIGSKVFINESVTDGIYLYKSKNLDYKYNIQSKLLVKDGLVVENYYLEQNGNFIFEKKSKFFPQIGDKVFLLDNKIPENGKVKYNWNKSFYIENGVIVK